METIKTKDQNLQIEEPKTDESEFTSALRIICKNKQGNKKIPHTTVFGFQELSASPLEGDSRKTEGQ